MLIEYMGIFFPVPPFDIDSNINLSIKLDTNSSRKHKKFNKQKCILVCFFISLVYPVLIGKSLEGKKCLSKRGKKQIENRFYLPFTLNVSSAPVQ
jgi:hypothetical protein